MHKKPLSPTGPPPKKLSTKARIERKIRRAAARQAANPQHAAPEVLEASAPEAPEVLEAPTEAPEVLAAPTSEAAPEVAEAPEVLEAPVSETAAVAEAPQALEAPTPEIAVAEPEAPEVLAAEPEPESDESPFAALGLSEPIARAVAEAGFEAPTPIQARSIPILLSGRDLIGQAQTGTGKTAAFALPIIQKVDAASRNTQSLIMAPTRELAIQVADGIHKLAKHSGLRVVPVYGGQPIDRQLRALHAGAQIVVGTPGRIQDHLRRGSLSLSNVSICVLDEADEMLALGFFEEIEAILGELPEGCQHAFFSATMPPRIAALIKKFAREPERVSIESKHRTIEAISQSYYEVAPARKLEALARVLDMEEPGPTIVFCRTRQETQDLSEALRLRGHAAEPLHGDMNQAERERVLRRFREGASDLLIATDVAARGLDIDSVTHVINFDMPWDAEQYIHRVGRTGRAGRAGDAITFVTPRERRNLKFIERAIGAQIKPVKLPTAADIAARRRESFKESLREALREGKSDGQMATVEELSEEFDLSEIAAAALQMLWQSQHATRETDAAEAQADGEHPEAGMARLFVGAGRQDRLSPRDLVAAITNEAGLSGQQIGTIDVLDRSSFVEVPASEAEAVIVALRAVRLGGRKVNVQIARPMEARR